MSSNMLAGERRWASARRGGMTVLGKVAVPKPLNLPSQRLENHGVDPSVEIVPKGTIGWGSRPSSSGSNAWVSSSQSPNADGRPSSGGSGTTRPSTAGSSDRTHEPVASAWGSNSRPSSASGALASNHSSSTSLRPKSAETRPNSSQLSRFAETVSESSVAWGPNSAAERLGGKSSKGDGFSLSSGDFPTLGTEKENTVENFESQQDHGRPSSASGRVTPLKEDAKYHSDSKSGVVNTWRPEGSQSEDDSFHPGMDKWPGEPPQYFNPNIVPQHFDAWRGPHVNAPAGSWYRGPPRGPAFGAPCGFPMEPFPYYRPQVPPPGGPRRPHPKNGEFYQGPPGPPQMPESYARPGMSFRPGFYQGPPGLPGPRAFEGYYGPPMGYHINEREIPYMGLPAAPPVYNRYPGPGPNGPPDTDVSHARHKELDRKEEGENWQHNVQSRRNNEWGAHDDDAEREISVMKRKPSDNSSHNPSYRDCYSDSVDLMSFGGMHNVNVNDDGWTNKSASLSTFPPQAPELSIASERESPFLPPANKDPVLMQKIEGLNAKIRASNGRNVAFNANNNTAGAHVHHVPRELIGPGRENQIDPIDVVPRTHHGGQGKGKLNNQDNDGWQRKPITPGFSGAAKTSNMEPASGVHVHGPSFVGEAVEKLSVSSVAKAEGESVAEAYDSTDIQAQHAKMRELAKQRALQLQKEEEERIKEQKAKALAKLEELNRRTKAGEAATGQAEKITGKREEEESCKAVDFTVVDRESVKSKAGKSDEVSETLQAGDALIRLSQNQPPSRNLVSESDIAVEVSVNLSADASQTGIIESNASHGHTLPVKENTRGDDRKAAVHVNDGATSMYRRTGYKQKQQKTFNEKSVPNFASEAHKSDTVVTDVDITSMEAPQSIESNVHGTSNTVPSTTTQRKKVNKSGKNKHKLEETQASSAPPVTSDKKPEKKSIPESKALEASYALQSEESESRSTNNWKQPIQRIPRSQHAKRFTDKAHGSEVIWAPVHTHNKSEDSVEASEKSTGESTDLLKSDNAAQNTFKGKRAEMERYIPKPVAKELAQQVSVVPLLPEVSVMVQFGSVDFESTQNVSSTNASFGSVSLEIKEGAGRHSKNKKEQHGHRRQGDTRHSPTYEPKHIEQFQLVTSDKSSANSEINASGNVDADMSSNTTTVAAVSRSASVKDHGATDQGKKRVPAPRRTRNNPDLQNTNTAEMHGSSVQLAAPDVNYNDRTVYIREHLGTGERTFQWIPKSHTNSTYNQYIDKPVGNESVINKLPKKVQPSQRKVHVHDKEESSNIDNSLNDSSNLAEESMSGHHHQGFNRENKPIPTKGHPNFPNQDPVVSGESDFRRHGGRSNRCARGGHEFYGDRPSGQANRPHNVQRQRQYEYQPVGPSKGGNLEKHDELTDGANHGDQRFRERGHSQSKHGGHNFTGQGGAGRVESGRH